MTQPLLPAEMFPAGVPGIDVRRVELSTGVTLRIAEAGESSSPPVVMLAGWGESIYSFRHAFDELPKRGLRVIAVDQRGQGLSDKPRGSYSCEVFCEDLDALLAALGLSRATLVGHSMGGGVALRYAIGRPQRVARLILVNPTGLVAPSYLSFLKITPHKIVELFGARLTPRIAVEMMLKRIAYGDPSLVAERDIDEYWAPTQLPGTAVAADATIRDFDWNPLGEAEIMSLTVPAVVILGEADRLLKDSRSAAERLPGATVRVFQGGHCVHEEQPEDVYPVVAEAALATSSIK